MSKNYSDEFVRHNMTLSKINNICVSVFAILFNNGAILFFKYDAKPNSFAYRIAAYIIWERHTRFEVNKDSYVCK